MTLEHLLCPQVGEGGHKLIFAVKVLMWRVRDSGLFSFYYVLTDRAGSRRSGSPRFCFSFGFSLYFYFYKLFRRFNVSGFE